MLLLVSWSHSKCVLSISSSFGSTNTYFEAFEPMGSKKYDISQTDSRYAPVLQS